MNKGKKLYEGKAKIIYETNDKNLVIQHFKDDATAFNALKKANIEGKGVLNNRISEHLLSSCNKKYCYWFFNKKTWYFRRNSFREAFTRILFKK